MTSTYILLPYITEIKKAQSHRRRLSPLASSYRGS